LRFPPPGLTLRWHGELLDPARSSFIHLAALHSVVVARAASALATALAIAFGLAALMFVSWLRLPSTLWLIARGHTVVIATFVLRYPACWWVSRSWCCW
jgi:putative spermidine/putrescine transport system permease protein